jgi:hypothetical protein
LLKSRIKNFGGSLSFQDVLSQNYSKVCGKWRWHCVADLTEFAIEAAFKRAG